MKSSACLYCYRMFAVAMSSPICLGDNPSRPTYGAREEEQEVAPTSPPTLYSLLRPRHGEQVSGSKTLKQLRVLKRSERSTRSENGDSRKVAVEYPPYTDD